MGAVIFRTWPSGQCPKTDTVNVSASRKQTKESLGLLTARIVRLAKARFCHAATAI
jgi:hypothetical protein